MEDTLYCGYCKAKEHKTMKCNVVSDIWESLLSKERCCSTRKDVWTAPGENAEHMNATAS